MDLIIASNNNGKIKEYKKILEPFGFTIYSQKEKNIDIEVNENGSTFEENATLKAEAIYNITNVPVISDDSGLEVEALNNEPGIYSARYKGITTDEGHRKAILEAMEGQKNRKAKFTTCICFIDENGEKHYFKGVWNGKIALEESGEDGFGYDAIFIANGEKETTATLGVEFKNKYSHRAQATKLLVDYLKSRKL